MGVVSKGFFEVGRAGPAWEVQDGGRSERVVGGMIHEVGPMIWRAKENICPACTSYLRRHDGWRCCEKCGVDWRPAEFQPPLPDQMHFQDCTVAASSPRS